MLLSRFPFLFGQAAAGGGAVAVDYFQVAMATSQSGLAVNVGNRVNFDTVLFDTLGGWDGVNFQFKPTLAGKWLLSSTLTLDTSANGTPQTLFNQIRKNDVLTQATAFIANWSTPNPPQLSTFDLPAVIMSANGTTDFFNVDVLVLAVAGTYAVVANASYLQSYFTGLYLGT